MADAPPPRELPLAAYVVVFVLYCALGYVFRTLILNWIVGPVFLFVALYLIPRVLRREPSP